MESRQSNQSKAFTFRTALGLSALGISASVLVLGCVVTNEETNGEAPVATLEQRLETCVCVPRGYCDQGTYAHCTRRPTKGECGSCTNPGRPEACVVRAPADPCEQVRSGVANPSGLACNDSGQCVLANCKTCWDAQTTIQCSKTDCGSEGVMCLTCTDSNPCTDSACSTGVCTFPNDDTNPCDDSNDCTTTDHCASGSCTGTPLPNGTSCTTNAKSGQCLGGVCCGGCVSGGVCQAGNTPTQCGTGGNDCRNCQDQSQCTNDSCDVATGSCNSVVISCNDKNVCTNDNCSATEGCYYTERSCNDANACTVDSCDPASGCVHSAIVCDDLNPCTTDACDAKTGCTHTPLLGQACNDADPCTFGDACSAAGECAGALRDCNDANVCTADACLAGICVYAPIDEGLPCDDGSSCTTDDPVPKWDLQGNRPRLH